MIQRYMTNVICIFRKHLKNNIPAKLGLGISIDYPQPVRCMSKHWNPKFKRERKEKVIKIQLPNFHKEKPPVEEGFESEELRSKMKEYGLWPRKQWIEKPLYISCTPSIFEAYVPPEGDGKFSIITKEGVKQTVAEFGMKGKSTLAIRKIKSYDESFTTKLFPEEAKEIYIKAHEALAQKDKETLIKYATEHAYSKMVHNIDNKTIRWKFLESLEPQRIVHARSTHVISKDNIYAQITVRFHTQQILSVYDRFGRLLQGSEILKKDVLEYIVFEKHLANEYGSWRVHEKIIPAWMPPRAVTEKTHVIKPEKTEDQPPLTLTENKKDIVESTVN